MTPIVSTGYAVYFNDEAYGQLNTYLQSNGIKKIFILVDTNTGSSCLNYFLKKLNPGITSEVITIPAGEKFKNIDTCTAVWKKLTLLDADRKSLLINLGGGMVTDLGGFVASTFKRGIRFINIPTTVLSMVDAAVGSKTGVDLDNLKNLIGIFANPEMVLVDSNFLKTLSDREFRSGIAEIIKYGLTFNAKLLNEIYSDNWKDNNLLANIIYTSIAIKNDVVLKDLKESSLRKVLNFGHTIGHAVESYYLENPDLPELLHGEAIAIGMVVEGYLSHKLYDFPMDQLHELSSYIHKTFGKIAIDKQSYAPIIELMKYDKKNVNGAVNYILLEAVEKFVIDVKAPTDLIKAGFDYYNSGD